MATCSTLVRGLVFSLFASAAIYSGACSSSQDDDQENSELADVEYVGATNDEGLEVLLDATPITDAASAPVITAPSEGAKVSSAPTFAYHAGAARADLRPNPRGEPAGREWLRDVLAPIKVAHAHGAPMNGDAFLLSFTSDNSAKLLRVFTQDQTFTPSATDWAKLTTSGAVSLVVTHGIFEEGRLTTDGGPYVSAPRHFTAAP